MGWTQTAPTLPDGKTWEQEQTTQGLIQTLFHMHWTAKIARLKGNQIAIYVKEWCTRGSASEASWFSPPSTFSAAVSVNGQSGEEEALTAGTQYNAVTWYFTGAAPSGAAVTLTLNDGLSGARTITFTAPETDGNQTFVKVSGIWQPGQMKIKVGGVWTDAPVKIKVGGSWK